MDNEFGALAPLLILNPPPARLFLTRLFSRIYRKLIQKNRLNKFLNVPVCLIYSNTIGNGDLSAYFKKKLKVRLITHVHELHEVIRSMGERNLKTVIDSTDIYLAAARAVKDMLTGTFGISKEKIIVVPEFIEAFNSGEKKAPDFLNKIKPDDTSLLVGSVGFVDFRKGYDLFMETARLVVNIYKKKEIKFIWVGAYGRGKKELVDRYVLSNGLQNHVLFTGEVSDPYSYYHWFDLLYLPSREDPFPLVMLESSWAARPVVCFKNCGGMEEFIDEDTGILIDEIDARKAAIKIIDLYHNRNEILRLGLNAKRKVEQYYLIDKIAPEIYKIILNQIIQN